MFTAGYGVVVPIVGLTAMFLTGFIFMVLLRMGLSRGIPVTAGITVGVVTMLAATISVVLGISFNWRFAAMGVSAALFVIKATPADSAQR
jgi:hypothetical protein